jgi:hypothetical protein
LLVLFSPAVEVGLVSFHRQIQALTKKIEQQQQYLAAKQEYDLCLARWFFPFHLFFFFFHSYCRENKKLEGKVSELQSTLTSKLERKETIEVETAKLEAIESSMHHWPFFFYFPCSARFFFSFFPNPCRTIQPTHPLQTQNPCHDE